MDEAEVLDYELKVRDLALTRAIQKAIGALQFSGTAMTIPMIEHDAERFARFLKRETRSQ